MSRERQELKPCPFCGGEAEVGERDDGVAQCLMVRCADTRCSVMPDVYGSVESEIIAEWNRRPLEDARVAALRSAREDSARLDWIEARIATLFRVAGNDDGEWTCEVEMETADSYECLHHRGKSAREAIDAMRSVSLPQPERDDDGA